MVVTPLRSLVLAFTVTALGCHAQSGTAKTDAPANAQAGSTQTGATLSPELSRRVEVLIRERANVPPQYDFQVGPRTKSDVPGFDLISVTFTTDGKSSKPLDFLLSTDGKTLAQFKTFDISKDPKDLVSPMDRPARGGPGNAPVLIVGFDDLECPFCAKMNAELFPAILARYGNQVHIVYRDFPLSQHPWATRAAIDVNCVGSQSDQGYWSLVDYIHAHADEIGQPEKTVAKANEMLDKLARDEAKKQKIKLDVVDACIAKQDNAALQQSLKDGEQLGVEATPALFINGEKLEGAQPIEYVYRMIDGALIAAGQKPPAPVPVPVEQKPATTAAKPGN